MYFICGICVGILPNILSVLFSEAPLSYENMVCVSGRRSYRSVEMARGGGVGGVADILGGRLVL